MESLFILGHFELRISKTDERLLIEAENQQTSEIFSKKITDDMAKGLSKDSFFDMQTIYQVLTEFFANKPPSVSVSLSDEGRLAYSYQFLMGSIAKEVGFAIQLEKQETDPLKSMEKTIMKLNQRISQLEEQGKRQTSPGIEAALEEKLEKIVNQQLKGFERIMLEKMDQFGKKFAEMEKKMELLSQGKKSSKEEEKNEVIGEKQTPQLANIKSVIYKFPDRIHDSPYLISNNNRTATRYNSHSRSASGDGILLASESLDTDNDIKFSIYISKNDTQQLGIGITETKSLGSGFKPLRDASHFFQYETYYVYMSNGCSWKNGACQSLDLPVPQNEDIFTFVFEAASRKLTIYQNEKEVDNHTFRKEDIYTKILCPFIYGKGSGGSAVSFC